MIEPVTEKTLPLAGAVHATTWQESHKHICSAEFLALHTNERQTEYLKQEQALGKRLFLLLDPEPVGIVSIFGSLIENLYVLPQAQGRGYGTALLTHALSQCSGTPTLWVLSTNQRAIRLYQKNGFSPTGAKHVLSPSISEIEMQRAQAPVNP